MTDEASRLAIDPWMAATSVFASFRCHLAFLPALQCKVCGFTQCVSQRRVFIAGPVVALSEEYLQLVVCLLKTDSQLEQV